MHTIPPTTQAILRHGRERNFVPVKESNSSKLTFVVSGVEVSACREVAKPDRHLVLEGRGCSGVDALDDPERVRRPCQPHPAPASQRSGSGSDSHHHHRVRVLRLHGLASNVWLKATEPKTWNTQCRVVVACYSIMKAAL
eukprot:3416417-Rhodomonas_salina.6